MMGQVIALRSRNIRPEVISGLEGLLAKAKCGELVGWFGMGELSDGRKMMVSSGTFADDPSYTAKVAATGLQAFCDQMGIKKSEPVKERMSVERLPRRLRRN